MKITSKQLRRIINEELQVLKEQASVDSSEFAMALPIDQVLSELATASTGERIEGLRKFLREIPIGQTFTPLQMTGMDPVALDPSLQDKLNTIDVTKVAISPQGTSIFVFGEGDSLTVIQEMVRFIAEAWLTPDDISRGSTPLGALFTGDELEGSARSVEEL